MTTKPLSTETLEVEGYAVTLTQEQQQTRRAVAWNPDSRDEYTIVWRWTAPADEHGFVLCEPRTRPSREEALAAAQRMLWVTRRLRGVGRQLSREDYERACAAAEVTSLSDAAILAESYAMEYADYYMGHYEPEATVAGDLAQRRYRDLTAAAPVVAAGTQAAAIGAPFKPDASRTTLPCAVCGATTRVAWIAGAGAALCVEHQDDY